MTPIRTGIINCDTHGAYFGAMMQKHDPIKLRTPLKPGQTAHGTWTTGGAYFYLYTHYARPTHMTAPFVEGFEITRIWDRTPDRAALLADIFDSKPVVCDAPDQVSNDVDLVFVACCNGIGEDHFDLAKPGIEKGVPTYVDKPLAYDLVSATAILDLAVKRETPVLSLSILRALPAAASFAARLPELGNVALGSVRCGGEKMSGFIHAVSLAQHVFGAGGVDAVQAMGRERAMYAHLTYHEGEPWPANGVALLCDAGATFHSAGYASAYGPKGAIHSGDLGDFEFPFGAEVILNLCKKMVQTGKPPVSYNETLENIAVATAARQARDTGKSVRLEEIGYDSSRYE